ncbi:condensation domain-containing protein [Acinetobacter junii]|uniref:condensation domain-containing protein n=1 Tax=Acinetobacter junii TaxID=40215 RepID=UPI001F34CA18|nr:condensation domain-containing protein [Acinetobacter junii]UOB53398.1 condensation domain-containing protein [Acinetobacter junii]
MEKMLETTPFNTLDSAFLNLDSKEEPLSVQLEIRVDGSFDKIKLTESIRAAIQQHPMTRAYLKPVKGLDSSYTWRITDQSVDIPLEIVEASSEQDILNFRSKLQSQQILLDSAPPLLLLLVRHSQGDYLMMNLSHVAGDGLSSFRIMTSIARHYANQSDPVPTFNPLEKRDLKVLAGSQKLTERIVRSKLLVEHLRNSLSPPIRVKTKNVPTIEKKCLAGYGFININFSTDETQRIKKRCKKPSTINDYLLASLILTIKKWNLQENGPSGRISIMMPVNLRPKDWWYEVVTNFSSYVPISLMPSDQINLDTTLYAVTKLTMRLKEDGGANALIDFLEGLDNLMIPAAIRQYLRTLTPLLERTSIDTAVLSNLGQLNSELYFAEAGKVKEIWFSPPSLMPMGVTIGAASMNDQLFLTLRYRKAQFNDIAALEFANIYKATILNN